MSLLSPPPMSGSQPPDDVDQLLRAFFSAQLPPSWPSAPAPLRVAAPAVDRATRGWPLIRSRLALAASVFLLILGSLLLAGAFQGRADHEASPVLNGSGTAERHNFDGTPAPLPHEARVPAKLKVDESLIQEPNGTTIHVDVIDWPTTPK